MSYTAALTAIQAGEYQQALTLLAAVLSANPADVQAWYAQALAQLNLGHFEQAIVAVQTALGYQPELAKAHCLQAKAYEQLGQITAAIAAYKQAIRGYIAQSDKASAQACLDCLNQLQTQPKPHGQTQPPLNLPPLPETEPLISLTTFLAQIKAQIQAERYSAALGDLNWWLQVDPHSPTILGQRGFVYAKLGNHSQAMADLAKAMQLAPEDPELRWQRGIVRRELGDARGAIADFSALLQAQQLNPVSVLQQRGQAYQQFQDWENAFKDYANALGIETQNPDLYRLRAEVQQQSGNLTDALKDYQTAASLYMEQGQAQRRQQVEAAIATLEADLKAQADAAAKIIRVPIKRFSGNTPVIEVIFNGNLWFDMVLDTGASSTILTEAMARLLNVEPIGYTRYQMADGWIREAPIGLVSSAAVGAACITNLQVIIISTAQEGLLGQNFFSRYDLRILRTEIELSPRG